MIHCISAKARRLHLHSWGGHFCSCRDISGDRSLRFSADYVWSIVYPSALDSDVQSRSDTLRRRYPFVTEPRTLRDCRERASPISIPGYQLVEDIPTDTMGFTEVVKSVYPIETGSQLCMIPASSFYLKPPRVIIILRTQLTVSTLAVPTYTVLR